MSQLYYNDVVTDIASCNTTNEVINYFRKIDDKRLTDDEWQELLSDIAEKCNTSVTTVLSCLEQPDDTNFEEYIKSEEIEYPMENNDD